MPFSALSARCASLMPSFAQLEETDVACLFVSHDRYFTRAAATRFLEFRRGRLIEVEEPDSFFDAQSA